MKFAVSTSMKERMMIDACLFASIPGAKAPSIEFSLERVKERSLSKVLWQNDATKSFYIMKDEVVSIVKPRNDARVLWVVQDFHELRN